MGFSQLKLSAFASGIVVPIEAVPDPVFAGRMLGDGLAIDPTAGVLYAPCDGTVAQLHRSHHACVLESADGVRMLLHIGIDTVLLKGEGFTPGVAEGEAVRAGQPLIEFDIDVLKRHGKPVVTMLVIENGDAFRIDWRAGSKAIAIGEPLMTVVDAGAPAVTAQVSDIDNIETANGWATVRHAGGLHARPCALLAKAVKKYDAAVEVRAHGKAANARSATAIMGLAIGEGEEVEISASGANAGDALEAAIIALETPSEMEHAAPAVETVVVTAGSLLPGQLAGVVASPGMAMGFTVRLEHAVGAISEQGEGETLERRALAAALHAVVGDIEATIAEAERRGFAEQAEIFAAHRVLADDPEMFAYASGLIAAGKSAAFAWRASVEAQCATLSATGNPLLVGRVADLRDIERQVLRKLAGDTASEPDLPPNAVVLADDLVPSDFAVLVRAKVAAIVTAKGGATSHIAILARAQGIPTLVAVGLPLADVRDGVEVIVDAERGVLDLAPTAERIARLRRRIVRRALCRRTTRAQGGQRHGRKTGTPHAASLNSLRARRAPVSTGRVTARRTASAAMRGDQELDIALGAGNRAWRHAFNAPALPLQPGRDLGAHPVMHRRIAHHAALAHFGAPGLELRLDQRQQPGVRFRKAQRPFQHLRKADEARITDDQVDRFRKRRLCQRPRAQLFEHHHPRVQLVDDVRQRVQHQRVVVDQQHLHGLVSPCRGQRGFR